MIPDAFKDRMRSLLGDEYESFIRCLEYGEAVRSLRVNTLKCTPGLFEAEKDFDTVPLSFCREGYNFQLERIGGHFLHHAGAVYVQDPSAMATVEAAREYVRPGMRVLDMCAAPGGKTAQLAALLEGRGTLTANEVNEARARVLRSNTERMGARNATVTSLPPERIAEYYPEYFDFVLCDAPCSGEGMFRKYSEAVSEWSPQNVTACALRQRDILSHAAKTVCGGGYLLYSTCTFSVEENEENAAWFLHEHPDFELIPLSGRIEEITAPGVFVCGLDMSRARRFYPHRASGEGQFMCLFRRRDGGRGEACFKNTVRALGTEERKICTEFLLDTLGYVPGNLGLLRGCVFMGEELSAPDGTLSCGVALGEIKKKRLEPHHQFFSAYGGEFRRQVRLEPYSREAQQYLRGEGFPFEADNGWCAVLIGGIPVGGGKAVGGYVKNHYPKGLRLRDF